VPAEEVAAAGADAMSFDELVTESDCLVIQAPLTAQTHHLFDEVQLRRMKPTAILINTARGPIVEDRDRHRATLRRRGGRARRQRAASTVPGQRRRSRRGAPAAMTVSRGMSQITRFSRGPVKTARTWECSAAAAEAIQKIAG